VLMLDTEGTVKSVKDAKVAVFAQVRVHLAFAAYSGGVGESKVPCNTLMAVSVVLQDPLAYPAHLDSTAKCPPGNDRQSQGQDPHASCDRCQIAGNFVTNLGTVLYLTVLVCRVLTPRVLRPRAQCSSNQQRSWRTTPSESAIGCYTEHRLFGEPTKGSLGKATPNRDKETIRTNRFLPPSQGLQTCDVGRGATVFGRCSRRMRVSEAHKLSV
jgi:hypothetical protein